MSEDNSLGKQIPKSYFVALVREQAHAKAEMSEISGDLGERLKKAQDGSNLHLKAFRVVCTMNRMEEQKRNAFRDSLMLYWDFADEELWGGKHVGDLDKMARAAAAAEVEQNGAVDPDAPLSVDEQMAENGRLAAGIKQTTPEQEAVTKRRPGRPKKAGGDAADDVPAEALDDLRERGRIDFHDGKPGVIPEELVGKLKQANAYLEGWGAASESAGKRQDAEKRGERFEDDAQSDRPSVTQNERREALAGADAPGSYDLRH